MRLNRPVSPSSAASQAIKGAPLPLKTDRIRRVHGELEQAKMALANRFRSGSGKTAT